MRPPGRTRTPTRSSEGFYGWRIVGLSSVALILTAPGQTAAISAFVDPMITDLSISRSVISTAYLVGTLVGAASMPYVGKLFDRYGARVTTAAIGAVFALVLLGLSFTQGPVELTVGFAGVRMLGQGALGLCATTVVTLWFTRRRGTALGIVTAIGSAGISLAPIALERVISGYGWRTAWVVEAAVVLIVVVPLGLWGLRDHPADLGQSTDGDHRGAAVEPTPVWGMTRAEAARTGLFWLVAAAVATSGMLSTAVAFHQISLLGERGLSPVEAAGNFLPQTIAGLVATLVAGALVDRADPRWATSACMVALAAGLLAATVVRPGWSAIGFGLLIGIASGSIRTIEAATFARCFGTRHIGSIRGVITSVAVGSTALGPVLFAVVRDVAGTYAPALLGSALLPLVVVATAVVVRVPRGSQEPHSG